MNKKILFTGLVIMFLAFGFIFTACDTGHGTSPPSLSVEDTNIRRNTVLSSSATKTITVKFVVKNGGSGLVGSDGIVSTQDDSYLVRDSDFVANDFYITITIPEDNQYVNIRWKGLTITATNVTAKMYVGVGGNYQITLNYNGIGNVATENLWDVVCKGNDDAAYLEFKDAWDRAIPD